MSEWRDISTAPKDGTRIRLLIPYDRQIFSEAECADVGFWEPPDHETKGDIGMGIPQWGVDDGGCWRFDGDDGRFDIQPTHWMPLEQAAEQDCDGRIDAIVHDYERLLLEIAEALRPFAAIADYFTKTPDDWPIARKAGPGIVICTMADCRRAKAMLERINDGT